MVRSCKVASMQGVHTCTDMTLGWSATFALPKPAQRLSCGASHMEAQPLPLSQTCATLEMGRRSPQTFATLEKGGAFHREAQPSPLPNLRTADGAPVWGAPPPAPRSAPLGSECWRGLPLHHEVEFWLSPKSVKNAILWTAKALTKAN